MRSLARTLSFHGKTPPLKPTHHSSDTLNNYPRNSPPRRSQKRRSKTAQMIYESLPNIQHSKNIAIHCCNVYYFWKEQISTLAELERNKFCMKLWARVFTEIPKLQNLFARMASLSNCLKIVGVIEWFLKLFANGQISKLTRQLQKLYNECIDCDLSSDDFEQILVIFQQTLEETLPSDAFTLSLRVSIQRLYQFCVSIITNEDDDRYNPDEGDLDVTDWIGINLHACLANDLSRSYLKAFMVTQLTVENINFLEDYNEYKKYSLLPHERLKRGKDIILKYIDSTGEEQINLPSGVSAYILLTYKHCIDTLSTLPKNLFDTAATEVCKLIRDNVWRLFKSTMTRYINGKFANRVVSSIHISNHSQSQSQSISNVSTPSRSRYKRATVSSRLPHIANLCTTSDTGPHLKVDSRRNSRSSVRDRDRTPMSISASNRSSPQFTNNTPRFSLSDASSTLVSDFQTNTPTLTPVHASQSTPVNQFDSIALPQINIAASSSSYGSSMMSEDDEKGYGSSGGGADTPRSRRMYRKRSESREFPSLTWSQSATTHTRGNDIDSKYNVNSSPLTSTVVITRTVSLTPATMSVPPGAKTPTPIQLSLSTSMHSADYVATVGKASRLPLLNEESLRSRENSESISRSKSTQRSRRKSKSGHSAHNSDSSISTPKLTQSMPPFISI